MRTKKDAFQIAKINQSRLCHQTVGGFEFAFGLDICKLDWKKLLEIIVVMSYLDKMLEIILIEPISWTFA
jgi:hypothetical protein